MATLKLTLDNRRKYGDGRSPLIMRLTSEGRSTSVHLDIKLHKRDWDSKKLRVLKTFPNYSSLNIRLKEIQAKYEQRLLEIRRDYSRLNIVDLKEMLLEDGCLSEVYFYQFTLSQIEIMRKNGRFGNAESYKTATNRLIGFTNKNLLLSEIDYHLILKFETYLYKSGVSVNGIAVYMRAIRALINKAAKMDYYDMSKYPFLKFQIRTQKTVSRAIEMHVINSIIELELVNNEKLNDARNFFLLIFHLIGISFIDLALLKKENLSNGRIIYRRRKTGKMYSVKLSAQAISIFNLYSSKKSDYLLPQLGLDALTQSEIIPKVKGNLKSLNRYLKQIGVKLELDLPLTTYVARYSWANIAKTNGYSKDLIAEALGHSYGNQVTGIYLEGYGNEVIDKANEQIVSQMTYKI